ncbi:MAG: hypothetical protein ACI9PP_001877, partial [Halobacteriales archaeon]
PGVSQREEGPRREKGLLLRIVGTQVAVAIRHP